MTQREGAARPATHSEDETVKQGGRRSPPSGQLEMLVHCAQCGALKEKRGCDIARSGWPLRPLYCSKGCAWLGRRGGLSGAEKKHAKRLYDMEYRVRNAEKLKAEKAARHKRTYDPEKAREVRKANMSRHVAYCQRPEYKAWKSEYDKRHRAGKQFGDWGEAFLVLQDVEREIEQRMSRYDIAITNGTLNKAQMRRRALWQQQSNQN
jgi:hypothetical protein